jgi:hypothetical protein
MIAIPAFIKQPPVISDRAVGLVLILLAALALALQAQAPAPTFTYQVIGQDENGLELRFNGLPLRQVRADDNQNALSMDFQAPVNAAIFEQLPRDLPQWIAMAYASFDNGVIRATRPVTFLTRREPDGFSLRIVARGPMIEPPQPAPVPPPQLRGSYSVYPPPSSFTPPQGEYRDSRASL